MKVSKEELKLTERIFSLRTSLSLLGHGYYPFHEEAKQLIRDRIKELMSLRIPDNNQTENPTGQPTRVVHCKKEKYDVYIGRPSKWGNPFTHIVNRHTQADIIVGSRQEAIDRYREWIGKQPELLASLHELKGKTLGCWCKPASCHGDVLIELIQQHCK